MGNVQVALSVRALLTNTWELFKNVGKTSTLWVGANVDCPSSRFGYEKDQLFSVHYGPAIIFQAILGMNGFGNYAVLLGVATGRNQSMVDCDVSFVKFYETDLDLVRKELRAKFCNSKPLRHAMIVGLKNGRLTLPKKSRFCEGASKFIFGSAHQMVAKEGDVVARPLIVGPCERVWAQPTVYKPRSPESLNDSLMSIMYGG